MVISLRLVGPYCYLCEESVYQFRDNVFLCPKITDGSIILIALVTPLSNNNLLQQCGNETTGVGKMFVIGLLKYNKFQYFLPNGGLHHSIDGTKQRCTGIGGILITLAL